MDPLELIAAKRKELVQELERRQADVYAIQGAIQVLDELIKELSANENPISD